MEILKVCEGKAGGRQRREQSAASWQQEELPGAAHPQPGLPWKPLTVTSACLKMLDKLLWLENFK